MPDGCEHEHAVCTDCGELIDVTQLEQDVWLAQQDVRKKNAIIERLTGQRNKDRRMDPFHEDAEECWAYYVEHVNPRMREFNDERFGHTVARLKAGRTVEEIKMAIDGMKVMPYVAKGGGRKATGSRSERFDEYGLIVKNEGNLLRFVGYAEDALEREAGPAIGFIAPKRLRIMQAAMTETVIERLEELRGWSNKAITTLGLGIDQGRVVFPVAAPDQSLVGLVRYQPNPARRGKAPKSIAEGERELFPPPEWADASYIWLVEGESDVAAMQTMKMPVTGIPGVATWKDGWTERFRKFDRVLICLDCDRQGRNSAADRAHDFAQAGIRSQTIDLDEVRDDGYDVNDLLLDEGPDRAAALLSGWATASGGVIPMKTPKVPPMERITEALEAAGCSVKDHRGVLATQCPNHDDRHPSMSVSEGDDGRVLLHCHAGCAPDEIIAALGIEWKELFAA